MTEKVTVMVLKVDLQCASCYKKVKKVLCKFPQIRDQVYDVKANTVTITVVCCSPEKIRDKLCYKGAKAIKSIEIKEPPKPKPAPEKEKPHTEKPGGKPPKVDQAEKPKKDAPSEKQKPAQEKPVTTDKPPKADKPKDPTPAPAPASASIAPQPVPVNFCEPVHGYPHMPMYPTGICFGPCSEGYGGGPCYHGYGRPVPPPLGPYYDGFGNGYGYRANKSDYFSEENPQVCTIM